MEEEPQIEIREEPAPRRSVNISFQKNSNRKLKYLEAEPKLLGTTQIVLALFSLSALVVLYLCNIESDHGEILVTSVITIIAGSLGIAAQNLHFCTIKACLGMQVVACVGSVISIIIQILWPFDCNVGQISATCKNIYLSFAHLQEMQKLVVAVQVGLSATLAVYCCKVIECCSPSSSVPVVLVERPADSQ